MPRRSTTKSSSGRFVRAFVYKILNGTLVISYQNKILAQTDLQRFFFFPQLFVLSVLSPAHVVSHTPQVTLLVSMSGASTGFYMWGGSNPNPDSAAADVPPVTSRTTATAADAALNAAEYGTAAPAGERPCPTHGPTTGSIEADGSQVSPLSHALAKT